MNKMLLTPKWLIAAAVCVLLCTLLVGGSVWAQTATVPSAPAIESLTPSDQAITVVWAAPASNGGSDITSYDLRYIGSDATDKADDNWTVRDSVWSSGALQATITGLTNGADYDVQARAVNANGYGSWSPTVSGKAATVPAAPYLGYAVAGNGQIRVVWSKPVSDGGSDITSYDLRYIRSDADDSVDANWTLEEDFSQSAGAYRILGLTNGVAYHMQVRAINAAGDGAWSERVTRTPTGPPGTPSIDTVTPADESLTITWSPPASNGGATITGYNLRHKRDHPPNVLSVWTYENGIWTSGDLEYTLSGLDNGVRYRLGLQAVNSKGSGGWSDWNNPRTGIPGDPPEVPGVPTIDRAISDGTTVNIRWSAPADDGGADITSYDVRHILSDATDKADDNWTVLESVWTSGALRYTVGGLTATVQYDFQLRAVNSASAGSWSATVNNVEPSPPGAPVIGRFSEETPGQLWVSWEPPADDGGAPVTHYDLRHIRSDAEDKADDKWTQVDDLTGDSHTIVGLTSGVRYDVQVRAVNRAGDGSWSGIWRLSPMFERPNPPGNISVAPGDGTLTVRWSAAPAKSGVTVAGYKVSHIRSDHPGYSNFNNWTTSDLIPSETLQYAITGLQNSVWYTIDAYSISSEDRTSPPPAVLPRSSPGRVPAALGNLKRVSTHESSFFISWIGPSDNGGHTVTSYDIHHHPTSDPTNVVKRSEPARDIIEGPSAGNNTWVGNLTAHVEYKIQVRARNRIGAGPWSSLTLIPRKKPVDLTIDSLAPGDGTLTVSWTDGGDDEITGYELRYTDLVYVFDVGPDSPEWEYRRNITGTSPLEYTIDGLDNGVQYKIQVRGRNKYGELPSDWSRWKPFACCWQYGTPQTTPDTPSIGSVTPGDRVLTVSWSAPAEDGGRNITAYDLRYIRSDAADKSDDDWTVNDSIWTSGALRYALSGLTNGVQYDVQVRAVNAAGDGPWSPTRTGTPLTRPGAPSIDSVTPGDETLAVAWSAPASDGGRGITSYDLRYIRSDAPSKADANWTVRDGIWTSGALRYTLSGLTNGVDYDVQVRAANAVGNGAWSGAGAGKPLTTPSAPTIDSVTPGDETLAVAWSAPADTGGSAITGYDLRYIRSDAADKSDDNWTERDGVWSSGSLQYTLSGLTNGVGYDLQVRAVNEAGDGRWSGSISGTPQTIPAAPTIDSVTPGDEALAIAWSAPADTGGSTVEGYDARYIRSDAADKADANWSERDGIWTSGALEFALSSLTNGVRYDVQLRAVTGAGNGPWSATASATPQTAPDAPTINLITVGDGALAVSWSAPTDNGGSSITSYDARYIRSDMADKADDSWTERDGIWTSGVLRYTVDSLTNGVGYDVQVRAVNVAGEGPWSATASATPQTVTDAPTIDLITPGDGALAVSWSAPSDTGGSAITSYDVRYIRSDALDKADDSWTARDGIWTSGPLSYDLDGLTNGVGFDVQVRAVNDAGDGPWSATATDTPRTTPGAPTIDVISPGNYALSITWSAPADDGGSAITSYDLRYIRSDATDKADDSWTVREDIWSSGLLQYGLNESTGFNLSSGVRYEVQVRAVNTVADGPWSASETGTPRKPSQPVNVPGAPVSLVVTPGDGSLSIAWSAPADDGGADVTSYDLRYILSDAQDRSDANWTVEEDVWSSGAWEYTLSGLTNGDRYDLQVRAVNAAGNGPWSASETGTPSTVNAPGAPASLLVTPGDGSLSIAWSAPADDGGADVTSYDLRYILSDAADKSDDNWTLEEDVWTSGALEYTLSGLTNGDRYDLQVRAVNEAGNGPWSVTAAGIQVGATSNVPPEFTDGDTTTRSVAEDATAGADIGAPVEATDADDDVLTYTLGGADAASFDIDASSGQLSTKDGVDAGTDSRYTVEVTATDPSGATDTITVTIIVADVSHDCAGGGAVADAADNPGLVSDCEALLEGRDELAGTASLNWSDDTAMTAWEGVTIVGTPQRVVRLDIRDKGLDGTVPDEMGLLTSLTHLNMRTNGLRGSLPAELGSLTNLRVLNLHSNRLSGGIPNLSRSTGLEELYLPNNKLTGPVPTWLNDMTNMTQLWLWGNRLTGSIPNLSGMTGLKKLKLANNLLDGGVPDWSMLPPNVTWLIIDRNQLGGGIPDLSGLTSLRLLWLHSNELTGSVPAGDNFPASLDDLNLRDNMLMGEISDLSNLDNLTRLRLHNNSLTGEVPATLGGLDSLKYLWLHNEDATKTHNGNNSFTSIAAGVGDLADTLIEIALDGNPWNDDACVPAELANVAKNDYAEAGIEICESVEGL